MTKAVQRLLLGLPPRKRRAPELTYRAQREASVPPKLMDEARRRVELDEQARLADPNVHVLGDPPAHRSALTQREHCHHPGWPGKV